MELPSSLARAVAVGLVSLGLVGGTLSLTACEEETPEKKGPNTAVDPAEQARIDHGKDCPGAFKQLAEPLKALAESEAFVHELRHLVGAPALKCAQEMIDQKVLGMAYADARKVLSDPQVVTVLGANAIKKLGAE